MRYRLVIWKIVHDDLSLSILVMSKTNINIMIEACTRFLCDSCEDVRVDAGER